MSVQMFLITIRYCNGEKPNNVSPQRWAGMLKWLETRIKDKDFENES